MKVLLVDDSDTLRMIQKGILTQLGYAQIEEASDGLEALGKAGAFEPELILVDWNMPNMDGFTFAKQYRDQGGTTPIIIVTTLAEKSQAVESLDAGIDNFIIKPYTLEELSQRIGETMDRIAAA